ncbi:hypothetical protein M5689_012213 [Euphorbia peplus]|nr:hypothetical protein M5689_012213 [Euphorbia peplus]
MGCCMSSKPKKHSSTGDPPSKSLHLYPPPTPQPLRSQAAVAPPPLEEETVKEVLSETPICSKPPQIPIPQQPRCQDRIFTRREDKQEEIDKTPEISQASEIYSAADSYSTATTAVTEIRDDEVTSKKRVNRSPVKVPRKRPYNGEAAQKAPVRRSPAPVKRELTGRQGRSIPQRNVGSSRVGRDLGERSGRRSRSPATRTAAGVGVNGRGGGSPAKVVSRKTSEGVAKRSDGRKEVKKENDSVLVKEEGENDKVSVPQQREENESLDNPLVSLECFIFL